MSSALARLNLRPQEQRLVVVVLAVLFVVLNLWLVWPHFGDWRRAQADLGKARATLGEYQGEVANTSKYREKLKELESQGSMVLPAEQALQLTRTVQNRAIQSGVMIVQTTQLQTPRSGGANTNQFFEEQAIKVSVNTEEKALVNFLFGLGSGNSMIRVRDMDLRPDPGSGRTRLLGGITLVASYQKSETSKTDIGPAAPKPGASRALAPRAGGARTNLARTTNAARTNALRKAESKKAEPKTNALRHVPPKRTEPRRPEPKRAQPPSPTSNKL